VLGHVQDARLFHWANAGMERLAVLAGS
jgi:hypothetical protein